MHRFHDEGPACSSVVISTFQK
ncbi:hypothetical protein ACP3TC_11220 [Winslowiella sp. 2C04]